MSPRYAAWVWLWLGMATATLLTGCNGCRPTPLTERDEKSLDIDEAEKKKKEKLDQPKEDFEFRPIQTIPGEIDDVRSYVKPGHWVSARHFLKANHFDFRADLHTQTTDSAGVPWDIDNTPFQVASSRPVVLPKGQEKVFENMYFVPLIRQTVDGAAKSIWLQRDLRAPSGGRVIQEDVRQGTVAMHPFQYHFVVLAAEPTRYGYLQSLSACLAPTSADLDAGKIQYYRVFAPKLDRYAPLPYQALTWTSIAYLLWDDVPPDLLTSQQQQALVDWLHFGGQVILNGPGTLDKLRGSFLDDYLPAVSEGTIEIPASAIEELNNSWSLAELTTGVKRTLNVLPSRPMLGVELALRDGAELVPQTAGLLVERRVGQGRIVVSAFSLTDSRFLQWGSADSFLNATVLRRPRRRFQQVESLADTTFADLDERYAKDSRLSTTLRYFSRDVSIYTRDSNGWLAPSSPSGDVYPQEYEPFYNRNYPRPGPPGVGMLGLPQSPAPPMTNQGAPTPRNFDPNGRPLAGANAASSQPTEARPRLAPSAQGSGPPTFAEWVERGFWSGWRTSMAAWNDRSGAANVARQTLKDAAGISIPKAGFVLRVLTAYLAVLAPLNWLIFRLLGRVEWAWVSAPIIAMIGTFAVVRTAQLDIGFARSLTEIAIIEAHGNYPRAHATRYTALYTSLSTNYQLDFADDGTLALPFGASDYQRGVHDSAYTVTLRQEQQLRLSGFQVPSNKTGTIHAEQILDLGGSLQLTGSDAAGWQLENGSNFRVRGTGVLRRTLAGTLERAWIGELAPRSTVPIRFQPAEDGRPHFPEWDRDPDTRSYEFDVRALFQRLDVDQDGAISRQESRLDPEVRANFDRIDQFSAAGDLRWTRDEATLWVRQQRQGVVTVGQLCELASQGLQLLRGETRLVGWTGDALPGVTILPQSSQEIRRALFLVHLTPAPFPVPRPDVNLRADIKEPQPVTDESGSSATGQPPTPPGTTPTPPTKAPAAEPQSSPPETKGSSPASPAPAGGSPPASPAPASPASGSASPATPAVPSGAA